MKNKLILDDIHSISLFPKNNKGNVGFIFILASSLNYNNTPYSNMDNVNKLFEEFDSNKQTFAIITNDNYCWNVDENNNLIRKPVSSQETISYGKFTIEFKSVLEKLKPNQHPLNAQPKLRAIINFD